MCPESVKVPMRCQGGLQEVAGMLPGSEYVFVRSELMATLAHYGVDHVQTGDLVLRLALLDELLHALEGGAGAGAGAGARWSYKAYLDDVFIELYGPDCPLSYRGHLGLRDRRLGLNSIVCCVCSVLCMSCASCV